MSPSPSGHRPALARQRAWIGAVLLLLAAAWSRAEMPSAPEPAPLAPLAPVRFVLTFDDGPSGAAEENPTESILDALADNPTQPQIKAIFFLQTRLDSAGASERGRALMAREQAQGHVLALHTGTAAGHRSHRNLSDNVLAQSLQDGVADLTAVTGRPVSLVRPPYWAYDERTLAAYARQGLDMLLTDISANDGKTWGYQGSLRRYIHMASEMGKMRERIQQGELAVVDGVIPVVVTFHDTNSYTAEHLREYLAMIVDEARKKGLTVAPEPFYADTASLKRAAVVRARDVAHRTDMTPWWWRWLQW